MCAIYLDRLCYGWIKNVHGWDTIWQIYCMKCLSRLTKTMAPLHSSTWTQFVTYCTYLKEFLDEILVQLQA